MKKFDWPLAGILLIHIALSLAFNIITPPFEAPDEDGHYLFVRYLQIHLTLPVQRLDPNGPRAVHPPLYFVLGALLSAWVPNPAGAERIDMQINPHIWYRYDDPHTENKAMWIHYGPDERWPYAGQARVIHLVRLLSLGFSALGVWLTYLAARRLRPGNDVFAWLATGLVAFNPMLLFMSGVLQNNTTMLASAGAVLYALSITIRSGFKLRHWISLGTLLGMGALLQLSALTMAAPIGLALLYAAWRSRKIHTLIEGCLGLGFPFLALTGWWFWRNLQLYSTLTGNNTQKALWGHDPITPLAALRLHLMGILGRFGQGLMITYPPHIYWIAGALVLFMLAGLVKLSLPALRPVPAKPAPDAGRSRLGNSRRYPLPALPSAWWRPSHIGRELSRAWQAGISRLAADPDSDLALNSLLWLMHGMTIMSVCGALLYYAATVAPGLPGRYMFQAFPAWAMLLAAGWLAWFRPHRQAPAALTFLGLYLAAGLYGLFGLLWPTYAMPHTPSAIEISHATPIEANIGDTADILGCKIEPAAAKPGQDLRVTVYWRPRSQTDVPYTVFVHLFSPTFGLIAQRDTYPGNGNYATTIWDVGRPFVDTYRLSLPPNAPSTDDARLLLGLYNERTMYRLPVAGANAGPTADAWVELGHIRIQP